MNSCEICNSTDFKVVSREIREGPGVISKCSSCGLVILNIDQTKEELKKYYNEEYQFANSLQSGKEQSPREHFQDRIKTLQQIVKRLSSYLNPNMRVLEIGCGCGELLYLIKDHVKEVVGVEINESFVEFINNELGIEAYSEDINKMNLDDRVFDIVICVMTLDHMPNPFEALNSMKSLMAKGGVMYIEVPNIEEAMNCYLPEPGRTRFNTFFWHQAHYFYFSMDTLTKLINKVGLNCEITCRHEYSLMNFFNWYFAGKPQNSFLEATSEAGAFNGDSTFEVGMNKIISEMDIQFHNLLSETYRGDTLCCIAQ